MAKRMKVANEPNIYSVESEKKGKQYQVQYSYTDTEGKQRKGYTELVPTLKEARRDRAKAAEYSALRTKYHGKTIKEINRLINPDSVIYKSEGISLKEMAQEYLQYVKKHKANSTYVSLESLFRNYIFNIEKCPFVNKDIFKIKPSHLQSWHDTIYDLGFSYNATNKIYTCMNKIYTYAISIKRDKYVNLPNLPTQIVNEYPHSQRERDIRNYLKGERDAYWTYEQYTSVMETILNNDKYTADEITYYSALLSVCFCTGIRFGELAALTWKDVDWKSQKITINKSLNRKIPKELKTKAKPYEIKTTKKGESKEVPLLFGSYTLLQDLYKLVKETANFNQTDFMFGKFNHPLSQSTFDRLIMDWASQANVKRITPHGLRHSAVSYWYTKGIEIEVAIAWCGHKDSDMIREVYQHVQINKMTDEYIAKFSEDKEERKE